MDSQWLSFEGFHHLSMMEIVKDMFFVYVCMSNPLSGLGWLQILVILLSLLVVLFSLVCCQKISWALKWRCLNHNCTCLDLPFKTIPMSDLFCRMVSRGEYIHSTHNPSTIQPTASTPSADAAPRILFVTYLDAARKLEFVIVGPCWTFRTGFLLVLLPPETWHDNGKNHHEWRYISYWTWGFSNVIFVFVGCILSFMDILTGLQYCSAHRITYIDMIIHISQKCWYVLHWLDIHSAVCMYTLSTRQHFIYTYVHLFIYLYLHVHIHIISM